ncbi:MAG: hypothetical protein RLZZ214_2386 [Verrucomicrobiota bacterium]
MPPLCIKKLQTHGLWPGFAVVSALVFYLSWLPQPQLGGQVPMPGLFSAWVDAAANENLRTAVPFLLLGLLAGGGLWLKQDAFRVWVFQWLLMVVIAGVAEGGQLLIPARTCDLGDIGWAAAGAALGLGIVGAVGHLSPRARVSERKLETPAP